MEDKDAILRAKAREILTKLSTITDFVTFFEIIREAAAWALVEIDKEDNEHGG